MRERGLSAGGINVRLRSINSFLTWLHEEGHIREPLRVKLLKHEPKPIQTLNDQDVKRLVTYRPNNFRHAFAAHSMKNGLDVFRLSRILGHTNIATTQIYLRSLGIEHLTSRSCEVLAAR
jgi:site-specific recombinase XerD